MLLIKVPILYFNTKNLTGQLKKIKFDGIHIANSKIISTDKSKNLGVIFDIEMNLKLHVNSMCKFGFYHVKNLSSIRNSLDIDSDRIIAINKNLSAKRQ